MRNFKDLHIWSLSHALTLKIYKVSKTFPRDELYAMTRQMRRSAASIPTNIAEGCGRSSEADFRRFLVISSGSCSELEYQLLLAKDLSYLKDSTFQELTSNVKEIRKMLFAFQKSLVE